MARPTSAIRPPSVGPAVSGPAITAVHPSGVLVVSPTAPRPCGSPTTWAAGSACVTAWSAPRSTDRAVRTAPRSPPTGSPFRRAARRRPVPAEPVDPRTAPRCRRATRSADIHRGRRVRRRPKECSRPGRWVPHVARRVGCGAVQIGSARPPWWRPCPEWAGASREAPKTARSAGGGLRAPLGGTDVVVPGCEAPFVGPRGHGRVLGRPRRRARSRRTRALGRPKGRSPGSGRRAQVARLRSPGSGRPAQVAGRRGR